MILSYVPLLQTQRELYAMPRGFERFRAYIATMVDDTGDLELPLVAMNPMGKDHIPALLDQYLAFAADDLAAEAMVKTVPQHQHVQGGFQVTLVLADDAQGQWTNRYATEFGHLFQTRPLHRRGWLVGNLWTSEQPAVDTVRTEILKTIFRGVHIQQFGHAQTLGEMMSQEGYAQKMAGCTQSLDLDEINYTREVIAPYLDSEAYPEQMVCLYGDEAAHQLGYEPMGLSRCAGFALALFTAQEKKNG